MLRDTELGGFEPCPSASRTSSPSRSWRPSSQGAEHRTARTSWEATPRASKPCPRKDRRAPSRRANLRPGGPSLLPAGTRLGHYVVGKSLGKGGMGTVHEARDTRSGTVVALKVLDEKWLARPDIVARFRREAAAALALRHPCIVFLLDADLGARPPYLVFELQKGGSLADRLDRENRLPWRDAARIGAAIAAGLEAIHERGLVHRDLKPGNVLLDKKGHPRIADFGLVRGEKGSGIDPTSLTESGEVVGTIEFMAPEQVKAGGEVKAPADLYALGCVLHTLLTGEPPFSGTGVDLMKKHLRERPRRPRSHVRGIPRALDALVLRLLD